MTLRHKYSICFLQLCFFLNIYVITPASGVSILKHVFKDGPKVWYHYIQKITTNDLRENVYVRNYLHSRLTVLRNVESFIERIQAVQDKFHRGVARLVISPTGRFSLTGRWIPNSYLITVLYFHIHFNTSIKVTFPMLYLGAGKARRHCDNNRLQIQNHGKPLIWYCGYLPNFDFFASSKDIEIKFMCYYCSFPIVEFRFTLIDRNIIESKQLKYPEYSRQFLINLDSAERKEYQRSNALFYFQQDQDFDAAMYFIDINLLDHPHPQHVYYVKRKIDLSYSSHMIQVRKLFKIALSVQGDVDMTVFDGPGTVFNLLKGIKTLENRMYFETSTFQCVVEYISKSYLSKNKTFLYTEKSLNYLQSNNVRSKSTSISVELLHLPNEACSQYFCLVYFFAIHGMQINISIHKITRLKQYETVCNYAGLVTAEQVGGEYREGSSMCESYDSLGKQSRSFYSSNASLLLFVYWYEQFNQISVTGTLGVTKCKSVQIDPCYYYYLCAHTSGNQKKIEQVCTTYLKFVFKLSNISLSYERQYPGTKFSISDSKSCTVIQLSNRLRFPFGWHRYFKCKFHLAGKSILDQMTGIRGSSDVTNFDSSLYLLTLKKCTSQKCPILNYRKISTLESFNFKTFSRKHAIYFSANRLIKEFLLIFVQNSPQWFDIIVSKAKTSTFSSLLGKLVKLNLPYHSPSIAGPITFNYTDVLIQLQSNSPKSQNLTNQHYLDLKGLYLITHIFSYFQIYKGSASFWSTEYLWDAKYLSKCLVVK